MKILGKSRTQYCANVGSRRPIWLCYVSNMEIRVQRRLFKEKSIGTLEANAMSQLRGGKPSAGVVSTRTRLTDGATVATLKCRA